MSYPLDEIVYFMRSYPVHEIESVVFPVGEIIRVDILSQIGYYKISYHAIFFII